MDKLQEALQELEKLKAKFHTLCDIIKCPVCWEIIQEDAVLCFNGHSVCQKCRSISTVCPLCRRKFSKVKKNVIASQVLDVILHKCKHENCSEIVKPGEDHEKFYCYRSTSCKIEGCVWNGPVNELIDHLISQHDETIFSEKNPSIFTTGIDYNKVFTISSMYSVHGHYLWEIEENDVISGLLTFTYIPVVKSNFQPDILVKHRFKARELSFSIAKRVSLKEDDETVSNFVSIPTSMLSHFLLKDKSEYTRSVNISLAND